MRYIDSFLRRYLLAATLFGLFMATPLSAQTSGSGPGVAALEAKIPALMEAGSVPGLSVAVLRDDTLFWSGSFGVKDTEAKEPVTSGTVFEAASLSKPVFAYAVLRMAGRGDLDLDAPLADVLPYERLQHEPRYRQITPRMILSHSTGLPNWGGEKLDLQFDPGAGFNYSGEGFVFLQKAVEKKTGRTLDEVARREVFEPLGMTRSSYVWRDAFEGEAAAGHDAQGRSEGVRKRAEGNAAASLMTTAEDYARFVSAVLRGEGLDPALRQAMLAPQVQGLGGNRDPAAAEKIWWGLGWGIQRGDSGSVFWHWGDNGVFKAFVAADATTGDGVVYFANSAEGLAIAEDLVSMVLPGPHPVFAWLRYERHDDPARLARRMIQQAYLEQRDQAGLNRYQELRRTRPEVIDERFTNQLGYFLLGEDRAEAAREIFRINVENYPASSNVYDSYGEALMMTERYEEAIENYEKSRQLDPENANADRLIAWIRDLLDARENPVSVPQATLRRYVGRYGPREIRYEEGRLVYAREGNPSYGLIPLAQDIFALEGLPSFRIRFEADAHGRITKIVGLYPGGRRDESPRIN